MTLATLPQKFITDQPTGMETVTSSHNPLNPDDQTETQQDIQGDTQRPRK